MHRILSIAFLVLLGNSLAVFAWVPADCQDRGDEWQKFHLALGRRDIQRTWQSYPAAVRNARPRSPLYSPFPYPKNDKEVVANFKYAYFDRLFQGIPLEKLPARELPIYNNLKEGRLRVEVVRLENWEPTRCTETSPSPFFYLLRFYDQQGKEVARSTQYDTGQMAIYRHVSEVERALPVLANLSAFVRARFGRNLVIEQPQYVVAGGLPYCWNDKPCIAFKSQGKVYVIDGGELLYEVDTAAPRTSIMARREQQRREGLQSLGFTEFDAPMISLGFEWARARLVGGQKSRTQG